MHFRFDGAALKKHRGEISLDKLAAAVGRNGETLRGYEKGRSVPRVDVALELSRLLGVSLDDLITTEVQA